MLTRSIALVFGCCLPHATAFFPAAVGARTGGSVSTRHERSQLYPWGYWRGGSFMSRRWHEPASRLRANFCLCFPPVLESRLCAHSVCSLQIFGQLPLAVAVQLGARSWKERRGDPIKRCLAQVLSPCLTLLRPPCFSSAHPGCASPTARFGDTPSFSAAAGTSRRCQNRSGESEAEN